MPIVGTAGHVDHGKSTLVMALTGRDPDRLAEEKRRGLTIDLGFAWTTLPTGVEIGFVDVPGHEKFIKNMLAGIEAVNVALLVVAADEGWKPQSEEHLAVIDLLEIPAVVVALTKIDRVDGDTLGLAQLEIEEQLEGTVAEGAPIIPVDSVAGSGLPRVEEALAAAVVRAEIVDRGRPRLWVDRSFTIAGAGTVVTGTLLDGELTTGETVVVYPDGVAARIRGIQSHEAAVEKIGPGNRTALNLAGIDRHQPARGSMIGRPGQWDCSSRLLVLLRRVRGGPDLNDRGAYQLHVGSGSWPTRLRMLDDETALLTVSTPIPAAMGDRFIVREVGRRAVVAGGRVLDPAPPARIGADHSSTLARAVGLGPTERADALLARRRSDRLDRIESHTNGGSPATGVRVGDWVLEDTLAAELESLITGKVADFHTRNPLRPGMPVAEAADGIGRDPSIVIALAERADPLKVTGGLIALAGFSSEMTETEEAAWQRARATLAGDLAVPTVGSLGLEAEQLHALLRAGLLVRVSRDLVFLPEQIDRLEHVVRSFSEPFTVADFRDRAGLTRKYAVPLLEYFDSSGVTVRNGDLRRVRDR